MLKMSKPQSKRENDMKTARKIINEYADKVNLYMKENTILQRQVDDLKETLKLNKDLMTKFISQNLMQTDQSTLLMDLKMQNDTYSRKLETLQTDNLSMSKKLLKLEKENEEISTKCNEEIEGFRNELFILRNRIKEKDSIIEVLKWEQAKKLKGTSDELPVVVEATKSNLDINNELNISRDVIAKVSKMLNFEKNKNSKLEAKIKTLEELINENKLNQNENKKNSQENLVIVDAHTEESLSDSSIDSDELSQASIKFPDKVNYNSLGNKLSLDINSENGDISPTKTIQSNFTPTHGKSNSLVPKLNLKPIQSKFSIENKVEKIPSQNAVEPNLNKTIDKLKTEIKQKDEKISQLKERLGKYKSQLQSAKMKISGLTKELIEIKEQTEFFNNNIEIKDQEFKKISPSTEDVSNKRGCNIDMIDSCSAERDGIHIDR